MNNPIKAKVTIKIETDGPITNEIPSCIKTNIDVLKGLPIALLKQNVKVLFKWLPDKFHSDKSIEQYIKQKSDPFDFSDTKVEVFVGRQPLNQSERFLNEDYANGYADCKRELLFAFQLRAQRQASNLSVLQLCKKSKVPQKVIREIEEGNFTNVRLNTLSDLASALDIGVEIRFQSLHEYLSQPVFKGKVPTFTEEVPIISTEENQLQPKAKPLTLTEYGITDRPITKALVKIKKGAVVTFIDKKHKPTVQWPATEFPDNLPERLKYVFDAEWIAKPGENGFWYCTGLGFGAANNKGHGSIMVNNYHAVEIIKKLN